MSNCSKKMVVALEKSLQAKDAVFRTEQFYRSDKTDKSYSESQKRKRELETAKKDYEKLEKEYLKSCIEMDQVIDEVPMEVITKKS